jgi:hypothetical protein
MTASNPKILNLDDLELPESDISIVHEGKTHTMRILTVELFLAQQKRALDHEKWVQKGGSEDANEVTDVVSLIRDAISEFFPTLPVNELETPKLFSIFAWLNELTAEVNNAGAPDDAQVDAEGNGQPEETPAN